MTRRPSLQSRLRAGVLGWGVLAWLLTAALTWLDVRHELDELLDSHLAQAAALLVVQQTGGGDEDDQPAPDAPVLHRYAPKVAFQVFHEGRLTLRSANAPPQPLMPLAERPADGFHDRVIDGVAWRVFAARGRERDVQVFVSEQRASRQDILWAAMRSALGPLLLAVPLLALAAWLAVRGGLLPLKRLGATLATRSPAALQPIDDAGAPAEMAPLLEALNGLFRRIAELLENERRFTADAAHELRTPIAAIRLQAQVAMGATEEAERRHALQATLQGCDRAARLVDQLLTLARLEADAAPPLQALDLAALVRAGVAELAGEAVARGQSISLRAESPCPVRGDPTLLGVLLRNLVDNAMRYSPPGAAVQVACEPRPDGVELRVEDSGPGVSEAELARLGERFHRVIGSGQAGSGLGLSIVRRIAQVHGARCEITRSAVLGGLRVALRF